MIVNNLADITGDGAGHPLVTDSRKGKWILLVADPANGAAVRVGGPNTAANVGTPVAPGGSLTLPTISDVMEFYPLVLVRYFAADGDKLYVSYGTEGSNNS